MTNFTSGEGEPGKLLNIAALRATRPELDAELTRLEDKAREWIARTGSTGVCYGVEIAHEGAWALALSRPGWTITQCSLDRACRGRHLLHGHSNASCRIVLVGGCPACVPPPRWMRIACDFGRKPGLDLQLDDPRRRMRVRYRWSRDVFHRSPVCDRQRRPNG